MKAEFPTFDPRQFQENYPIHELYRLFYRFFAKGTFFSGWQRGEDVEPGFIHACIGAFLFEMNHLDAPVDVNLIEQIHNRVIQGVLETNYSEEEFATSQTTFRRKKQYVQFGLVPGQNMSLAGHAELTAETPNQFHYYVHQKTPNDIPLLVCLSDDSRRDTKIILDEYRNNLAKIKKADFGTSLEKKWIIKALVRMVRKLERLHPFGDGNCRTLGLILLNRELMRHSMMPTIMDDPNQFDGFSQKELVAKVIEGQERFYELLTEQQQRTPHRSPSYGLKTGERISTKAHLVDFDNLLIEDRLEFKDVEQSVPFTGKSENYFEMLVHRLIIESALLASRHNNPCELTERLLNRLYSQPAEDVTAPTIPGLEAINIQFYGDVHSYLMKLSLTDLNYVIEQAIKSNAHCAVEYLANVYREKIINFAAPKFEEYSWLGHCVSMKRQSFIPAFLEKFYHIDILKCLDSDVKLALEKDDTDMLNKLAAATRRFTADRKEPICVLLRVLDQKNRYEKQVNQANLWRRALFTMGVATNPAEEYRQLCDQLMADFRADNITKFVRHSSGHFAQPSQKSMGGVRQKMV